MQMYANVCNCMHLIQLKVIMIMILILNLIIISITRTSSGFLCLTFFNHHQAIPFALFDIALVTFFTSQTG